MGDFLAACFHAPRRLLEAWAGIVRQDQAQRAIYRATPGCCHDCGTKVSESVDQCIDCQAW